MVGTKRIWFVTEPGNPYHALSGRAFWRPAVANRHFLDLEELAAPSELRHEDRVATAGSCFAQHIGRRLRRQGMHHLDLEPAPDFLSFDEARRHGFGIYSCRYGNIYTARQLLQLTQEAMGGRIPEETVWQREGRFYDALRPLVDPVGHETADEVRMLRSHHLERVRAMLETLDVFVFTLGLTETWESTRDGTVYPTAPGTIAGRFDETQYQFRNLRYGEILADMRNFRRLLHEVNPTARILLTVSPVPLTATASGNHVLLATTYSKATLRAVAGDLAEEFPDVVYFPSFEIIATHPSRAMFFNPDMRTVNEAGVDYVMSHFFRTSRLGNLLLNGEADNDGELICDEERLDISTMPSSRQGEPWRRAGPAGE